MILESGINGKAGKLRSENHALTRYMPLQGKSGKKARIDLPEGKSHARLIPVTIP
jgi:hypothetical protein